MKKYIVALLVAGVCMVSQVHAVGGALARLVTNSPLPSKFLANLVKVVGSSQANELHGGGKFSPVSVHRASSTTPSPTTVTVNWEAIASVTPKVSVKEAEARALLRAFVAANMAADLESGGFDDDGLLEDA